jgi:hypothetical protein
MKTTTLAVREYDLICACFADKTVPLMMTYGGSYLRKDEVRKLYPHAHSYTQALYFALDEALNTPIPYDVTD